MTDGILLAQIQRDPLLRAYDALIIDEAHERSLNIDFLLGYLTRLLPQRPDLRLVITSATIDSDRFARHFGAPATAEHPDGVPAPVVEVSGRTYPVEVRYRPLTPTRSPTRAPRGRPPATRHRPSRPPRPWESGPSAKSAKGARTGRRPRPGRAPQCGTAAASAGPRRRRARPDDRDLRGRRRAVPGGRATSWCSCPASGRSATPTTRCAPTWATARDPRHPRHTELCRCTRGCPRPSSTACSSPTPAGAWCWPPTSPRPRSPCPACGTWSTRARRGSRAGPRPPRSSACPSSRSARRRPRSAPAAAGAWPTAWRSGSTREDDFESRPEFTEPEILRTSLASVILQMIAVGVAASPEDVGASRSSTRRTRVRCATACSCWSSSGALGRQGGPARAPAHRRRARAGAAADRPAARADDRRGAAGAASRAR